MLPSLKVTPAHKLVLYVLAYWHQLMQSANEKAKSACRVGPVKLVAHSISKLLGVPQLLYELQNGELPGHKGLEIEVGPAGQFSVVVEIAEVCVGAAVCETEETLMVP